jgi:hypothetical protein
VARVVISGALLSDVLVLALAFVLALGAVAEPLGFH